MPCSGAATASWSRAAPHASAVALATFLSNVCRALDVEVVYDWNLGHDQYWGAVGHYSIGAKGVRPRFRSSACERSLPRQPHEHLVRARRHRERRLQAPERDLFYPLADLPDYVWKSRTARRRPHEGPNHFAELDNPNAAGDTLLSLFRDDEATLAPAAWIAFYRAAGKTDKDMGLLPFRVAQLYRTIVESLTSGAPDGLARALCAAGVMAHYVGDASQPLHASRFHDGRTEAEEGVHGDYETKMMTSKRREVVTGLDRKRGVHGRATASAAIGPRRWRCST